MQRKNVAGMAGALDMFRKKGGGEADQVNSKTISSQFEDDLFKEFLTEKSFMISLITRQKRIL